MTDRLNCRLVVTLSCVLLAAAGLGCSQPDPENAVAPVATSGAAPAPVPAAVRPRILAFGDSLTAGYGIQKSESYPAVLQRMLDERGYVYEVVNSGVSGETTAGGRRRIEKALDGDVRIAIIALGGNDGLRGLPVADLKANLEAMVDAANAKGAKVLIAGMEAPPQMGDAYTREFRDVFRVVAKEKGVELLPFLLEGVAGEADLNQADSIHPNPDGAKFVAGTVFTALEPLLKR
jgi:acyl-CoA thioesterase-1